MFKEFLWNHEMFNGVLIRCYGILKWFQRIIRFKKGFKEFRMVYWEISLVFTFLIPII